MKTFKGEAAGSFAPFLAEVSRTKPFWGRGGKVYITSNGESCPIGFSGVFTCHKPVVILKPTVVLSEDVISSISDGDFVIVNQEGTLTIVWDSSSENNTIFPTPACDCRCVMCPQPPKGHDEGTFAIAEQLVERLDPAKVKKICVSGGEPTLMGDRFLKLMRRIKERFDHAFVMLLTNGKNFGAVLDN